MSTNSTWVKSFLRAAEMHRQSASLLLASTVGDTRSLLATKVVYLSGYRLECSLKAYLLASAKPKTHKAWIEKFKANGHDLDGLLKWLAKKRRPLTENLMPEYRIVRKYWSSQLRYDARSHPRSPAIAVHAAANKVYNWVLEN